MKKYLLLLAVAALLCLPGGTWAQYRIELTPFITVGETYDDNIFLDNTNEVSDYITMVTPGASLSVQGQHTDLTLRYAPTFVRYADLDDQDTTRHSAGLTFGQDLTERLRFNLTNTYLNSEDPLEDPTDLQTVRRTRNKYWTNLGRANVDYAFGEENRVGVGFSHEYRENDDPTLDNSRVRTPFADLAYWFDVRNGVVLNYSYVDVHYWKDDALLPPSDDYTGNNAGVRYIRRFNPQSQVYVGYNYSTRDFEGLEEDYDVHDGLVGFEHAFSPEYSMGASAGYFIRVNDVSENQDGPTFTARLTRQFQRGSVTVGGDGGWGEEYLSRTAAVTDSTGFSQYYGGYANAQYQVLEPVSLFAGLSYRHDEDERERTWETWRGNAGVRWAFLRWFSLALEYSYTDRNDDIEVSSYTNNRVMLTLTASKPFRW